MASISAVALTNGITLDAGESIIFAYGFSPSLSRLSDTVPIRYFYVTSLGNVYIQAKAGDVSVLQFNIGFSPTSAKFVNYYTLVAVGTGGNLFSADIYDDLTDPANPILSFPEGLRFTYTGLSANNYVDVDYIQAMDASNYGLAILDDQGNIDIMTSWYDGVITSTIVLPCPALPSGNLVCRGISVFTYNYPTYEFMVYVWATGSNNIAASDPANYSVLYTGNAEAFFAETFTTTEIVGSDDLRYGAIGSFPRTDISVTDTTIRRTAPVYVAMSSDATTAAMHFSSDGTTWNINPYFFSNSLGVMGVAFSINTFIAFCTDGGFMLSENGIVWEPYKGDSSGTLQSVFTNGNISGPPAITSVNAIYA